MKKRASYRLAFVAFLTASTTGVVAQEEEAPKPQSEPPAPVETPVETAPSMDERQQELIDLIHQVERRLAKIDRNLSDAGAGVAPAEEVEDSGLDDLLRNAKDQGEQNIEDIDRILRLAQELSPQSQGGQSSQSSEPQSGESPLDSGRDQTPKQPENTPTEPPQTGEQPGEERPDDKQPGEGEEPHSPKDNEPGGENVEGQPRPEDGTAGTNPGDDANRWGELPVRYREVFRNQGGDELPVQYRDWIDAYHRRLSKSRR